jgi:hypothetical protein
MSSSNFLVVDEQPLTLEQALNYLQTAGKFQPFLLEILSQHVINQELKAQPDLQLPPEALEQILIDFRVQRELADPQTFQAWLDRNEISYETFRQQYLWHLTCERLKIWLSQSILQSYFQQRKPFLDQVVFSWIIANSKELADSLRHRIEAGTTFEQLTDMELDSDNEELLEVAIAESLSYGDLPEELRDAIDQAQPGSLIGPLLLDDDWYVFQVNEFLPAELDEELEAQLRDEIFAQWLNQRVSAMNVKLEVN